MHRLCFPSCAHGMFLPTGSMPVRTHDESKLHTSYTADTAGGLWSPPATVLAQTPPRTTAGDQGLARGTLSQNETGLRQDTERTDGVDGIVNLTRKTCIGSLSICDSISQTP